MKCPKCGYVFDKDVEWKSDKSQIIQIKEAIRRLKNEEDSV